MGFMSMFRSEASDEPPAPAESAQEEGTGTFRAVWNGTVIAESSETIEIEGKQYFPPDAVNRDFLVETDQTTVCHWKGTASYYDVVADGEVADSGAWYYPDPKDAASEIRDRIAFWRGVKVEEVRSSTLATP